MGQLRDDLIEAKALIDAPEKALGLGVALAFRNACRSDTDRMRFARRAFGAQHPKQAVITHADIMAQFDRAIAAAGDA